MIDTRFPPLPRRVVVPLYTQKTKLPLIAGSISIQRLSDLLESILGVKASSFVLANSASVALYGYLKSLDRPNIKVALPSFSCQNLVEAVIQAGCTPVFIDIGAKGEITLKSAKFAVRKGCSFFILPSYFGSRKASGRVIKVLQQGNVAIIFDEAQSFPGSNKAHDLGYYDEAVVVLFSFGYSKGVAGTGGGLLYMPRPDKAFNAVKQLTEQESSANSDYIQRIMKYIVELMYLRFPKIIIKLGLKGNYYNRLDLLLEESSAPKLSKIGIYSSDARTAYKNLKRRSKVFEAHTSDWEDLVKAISVSFGTSAMSLLGEIDGVPNIVAICINPLKRFQLLSDLSRKHIQSTWYYYPLSANKEYSKYPCEELIYTPKISSSVVILPFQWCHKTRQRKYLIQVIKELDKDYAI